MSAEPDADPVTDLDADPDAEWNTDPDGDLDGDVGSTQSSPGPRWRRLVGRLAVAIALVLLVAIALATWLLGTSSGRGTVIEAISSRLLSRTGWQLKIEDFAVDLAGGRIEVEDLRVGAPAAPALARLERAVAQIDLGRLLQRELVLLSLEVDSPTIDLAAPLPAKGAAKESPATTGSPEIPLDLVSWRIRNGAIENGAGSGWLASFAAAGIAAEGSLVDGAMEVHLGAGRLMLQRAADGLELPIELAGLARGPISGPWTLDRLEARGEALEAQLTGTLGLSPDQPFVAAFAGWVDPALLVPEIAPGAGRALLKGGFNLPSEQAWVDAQAEAFPLALLEPLLGERILASAGTIDLLDLEADLRFDGLKVENTRGEIEIVVRDGERVVAAAEMKASGADQEGITIDAAVDLLPAESGRMRASGRLIAENWQQMASARLEAGRLELRKDDLKAFASRLQEIWPLLEEGPEPPAGPPGPPAGLPSWFPSGKVEVEASFAGTLEDPRVSTVAFFRPLAGGVVRLEGSGSARAVKARLELDDIDPARLDLPVEIPITGAWQGWLELGGTGSRAELKGELQAAALEEDSHQLRLVDFELGAQLSFPWRDFQPRFDQPMTGHVQVKVGGLEAAATSARDVKAEIDFDGEFAASLLRDGLTVAFEAQDLRSGELELPALQLVVSSETGGWQIRNVEGLLTPPAAVGIDRLPFNGSGSIDFRDHGGFEIDDIERASLELDAGDASRDVSALLRARFDDGRLSIQLPSLEVDGAVASGSMRAEIPLGQALKIPGLDALAAVLPAERRAQGPIVLVFDLASVNLQGFERWTGGALPEANGDLRGLVRLDPDDVSAVEGRLFLSAARLVTPEGAIETERPLAMRLGARRAQLLPARLRFGEHSVDAAGRLRLAAGWRFDDPLGDLVESFEAEAAGAFDAALLDSYLPECRTEGVLAFSLTAAGDLQSPDASILISDGGGAAFTWDRPYFTRFSAPAAEIQIADGTVTIDSAQAVLNEGKLEVHGQVGEEIDLRGKLEKVRYRLDYGLAVETRGTFHFLSSPEPGKLEADLIVERGSLRRRIDAGQQVLDALLAPPALETGGAASAFDGTELAIRLRTEDGVRVKNNLADLRIGWAPLTVEGTLSEPRILGRLEADPDGRVYAYGQVIRLDRAALIFSGAPAAAPELDLQVTTSLEDPSLLTPQDQRVLASLAQGDDGFESLDGTQRSARVRESVASGLTNYFGDQLASRLGRALGRTQLRYQPLWIFGEADPEARLVVSRDISRYASVGVAFDLRQADAQTYLLEVGRLPRLPSLTGTLFSNDQAELGATFQQQLTFGGAKTRERDQWPRVADIKVECLTCLERGRGSVRELADRALSWRRGKPIEKGAAFDLELEVAERLQRDGFPDPRVKVQLISDGSDRVDLSIELEPGPRAEFVWLGEEPPRARRQTLRRLYRSDYSELSSLREIEETTERVWRSRGHPWPEVEVKVEASDQPPPSGTRTITITSEPGEAFDLGGPIFDGLPASVDAELQGRFLSQQARAELITGAGAAEARLLNVLRALGYPQPKVLSHDFDAADPRPRLKIESGPRRHLARLEVTGSPAGEQERLANLVTVESGAPLIGAELAAIAFEMERDLRQRGWVEARVRLQVEAVDPQGSGADVRFEAEPGVRQTLSEIVIEGAEVTRKDWVERLAGTEEKRGALVDATQVSEARRRLLERRLFEKVQVDVETSEAGEAVLRFDLRERPRYLAAYGLRWEESEGFGGLFDILDRNAGGRGIGLGLRALWVQSRKSLRLYSQLPKVFNSPLDLELFVEGFEEDEEGLIAKGAKISAQLKWPLRPRTEVRSYFRYRRAKISDQRIRNRAEETEEVPLLGFQIVHDQRDDPLDPRSGWFASADLSGSEDVVTSGESYIRLFAQVDHFFSFGERWTWAQGVRLGRADVFAGELPRDVRFFAGGARSLRGYANRSVGPREVLDDGGDRAAGGEALLILHEELRYDFSQALQGVLFYDAGNVWGRAEDLGEDLLQGIGLGVRYRSPIGLLRLDLAHPLDRRDGDDEVEVYFGLGHAF